MMDVLGIDVSKDSLDVVLMRTDGNRESTQVANNRKGFGTLRNFLKKRVKGSLHVCLEATGHYSNAIALFLHEVGYTVSVINPAQIKSYGDSQLRRTKTDAQDALLIADFCRTQQPPAWQPPAPEVTQLQTMVRHVEALIQMRQQEENRLHAALHGLHAPPPVTDAIRAHIAFITAQIDDLHTRIRQHVNAHPHLRQQHDLLTSIPGIGDLTAVRLMAELPHWQSFTDPNQVAAFAGLAPHHHLSGSSVHGRARLSKRGSARLRTLLFMPALVAQKYNPSLSVFAQRLRAAGKPKMLVVAALMRKLLLLAFAILKSGLPFDPHYSSRKAALLS